MILFIAVRPVLRHRGTLFAPFVHYSRDVNGYHTRGRHKRNAEQNADESEETAAERYGDKNIDRSYSDLIADYTRLKDICIELHQHDDTYSRDERGRKAGCYECHKRDRDTADYRAEIRDKIAKSHKQSEEHRVRQTDYQKCY